MRGKKLFWLLILIPLFGYSLPSDWGAKIDLANQNYLQKKYMEASQTYKEFLQEFNEKNIKELSDKAIFLDVQKSFEETDSLMKALPVLPLMKKGIEAENQKSYADARDAYFSAREHFVKNNITNIRFYDETIQGILEEHLLKRKEQSLGKISYAFLEQVKKDKERKKRIVFLNFDKDPELDFDVQTLVMRALFNVIEDKKSFLISDKTFSGLLNSQLAQARASGIDLVISGRYKKLKNDEVGLNFYVIDPILNKRLIEINSKTAMDFEFFEFIEKIANDLERRLKNYSRLEDFITIKYSKEGKQGFTQEFVKENTEKNIIKYLDSKILTLETAHLTTLSKNSQDFLNNFNLLSMEIQNFNQKDFPAKISLEDYVLKEKNAILKKFVKTSGLYPLMVHMGLSRDYENYEDYFDYYDSAKEKIIKGNEKYPGLKPVIDEIAAQIESDKKEVDEIVAKIGTRLKHRHGLQLGVKGFHKNPFRKSWIDGSDWNYRYAQSGSLTLGYVFDKRVFGDLWFNFNIGIESGGYTVNPEGYKGQGVSTFLGGGLKYGITDSLFIYQGLLFTSPTLIKDKNANSSAEIRQGESLYWVFGPEYNFSLFRSIDLGFFLHYGISLTSQKLYVRDFNTGMEKSQKFWNNFLAVGVTGYFNRSEFNVKPKEHSDKGFWISGIFSPQFEFNFKVKELTGSERTVNASCSAFGFGVSYRIYSNLAINWDNYLINFNMDGNKDNSVGNAKGIFSKVALELEYFTFFDFIGLFISPEINVLVLYEKSAIQFKNMTMGPITYEQTEGLSTAYFGLKPVGEAGIRFKIARDLNLKVYGAIPFSLIGAKNTQFGFKLEFKI